MSLILHKHLTCPVINLMSNKACVFFDLSYKECTSIFLHISKEAKLLIKKAKGTFTKAGRDKAHCRFQLTYSSAVPLSCDIKGCECCCSVRTLNKLAYEIRKQ